MIDAKVLSAITEGVDAATLPGCQPVQVAGLGRLLGKIYLGKERELGMILCDADAFHSSVKEGRRQTLRTPLDVEEALKVDSLPEDVLCTLRHQFDAHFRTKGFAGGLIAACARVDEVRISR